VNVLPLWLPLPRPVAVTGWRWRPRPARGDDALGFSMCSVTGLLFADLVDSPLG